MNFDGKVFQRQCLIQPPYPGNRIPRRNASIARSPGGELNRLARSYKPQDPKDGRPKNEDRRLKINKRKDRRPKTKHLGFFDQYPLPYRAGQELSENGRNIVFSWIFDQFMSEILFDFLWKNA